MVVNKYFPFLSLPLYLPTMMSLEREKTVGIELFRSVKQFISTCELKVPPRVPPRCLALMSQEKYSKDFTQGSEVITKLWLRILP